VAPYHNALIIIAIPEPVAAIFAASYSLALGRAPPHYITLGCAARSLSWPDFGFTPAGVHPVPATSRPGFPCSALAIDHS